MMVWNRKTFQIGICSSLLTGMLALLCSCGTTEAPSASETPKRPESATEIVHMALNDAPSVYAASPKGIYSIQQMRPGSYNLFFADAETGQEMYLCASPNCTHSTDECTSYLRMENGTYGFTLGFYRDHLYLFQSATTGETLPYLMQLDSDGKDRTIIASLKEGENFVGNVYGYGNSILCEISGVLEQGTSYQALIQIDLDTGSRTDLIVSPQGDDSYALVGTSQTELVYRASSANGNQYFTVDPASEEISLKEAQAANAITEPFDGNDLVYTVQKDYLCKYDRLKKEFAYQNLNTGHTQSFSVPELPEEDTLYGLVHLFDDQFALTLENHEGRTRYELIDSKTGALLGVQLAISAENQWLFLGEFGDRLIYLDTVEEKQLEGQGESGLIGETTQLPVYRCVSKAELLNGKEGTGFQRLYH